MRDVLMFAMLGLACVYAIRQPWMGIMAWTFISIMNPHTYGYIIKSFPVAASVVVATLLGLLVTREKRKLPFSREVVVLILLMSWFCITYPFSFDPERSFEQWSKVMKIDIMILVALYILHSKKHIEMLAWILVASIGFYGVKGGIFTLLSGGAYRVWGPAGSYIDGNNELALAMILIIPLMRYLQLQARQVWLRNLLLASMLLTAVAAIGSQSRGALLAILAMALVLWSRSRRKLPTLLIGVLVGAAIYAFMPESWHMRMATIGEYQEDGSAMGRINAWWMAFNLAKANFFGGGFSIYNLSVFGMYAPNPLDVHAAHSIYFQILGEHGFVGLALFMLLWMLCWLSAGSLREKGALQPQTQWLADLGAMCQVSLAGYAVGGAFLSLAYFDLPYDILILIVLGQVWIKNRTWEQELTPAHVDEFPPSSRGVARGLRL